MLKNNQKLSFLLVLILQCCTAKTENVQINATPSNSVIISQGSHTPDTLQFGGPIRTNYTPSPSDAFESAQTPNYKEQFLKAIGTNTDSCMPDKTRDEIGIYIFDLNNKKELVSINADTAFQYASAFKGPVLVYFLESCPQYWDVSSPEWNDLFLNKESARGITWYTSPQYRELVTAQLVDVRKWSNIETFFTELRVNDSQAHNGFIDQRYFVLNKVYGMVTHSNNDATADVLHFVYNYCFEDPPVIEEECGGANAVTAFNAWFTDFSGVEYQNNGDRRGLYSWDSISEKNRNGKTIETILSTYGLRDKCADQIAYVSCSEDIKNRVRNVMTARDYFQFYDTLYHLENTRVRNTAFDILKVDLDGPSRGNFKNLARAMEAESFSKNGLAYYSYGPIIAETGILNYKDLSFIVITLSFNASESIAALYGRYYPNGNPLGEPGLIQRLIEEQNNMP